MTDPMNDQRTAPGSAPDVLPSAHSTVAGSPSPRPGDGRTAHTSFVHGRRPADFIPGYQLLGEIHRGGQGVVYQARQLATERTVAIKVLHRGPFASADEHARFEREVRVLGQLKHPNIVSILHSGTVAGHDYFVMDFVDGPSLDAYLAVARLSVEHALRLFVHICDAVSAAHLRGVIHRDLKPGNIRVDREGTPHVLDFGLSKLSTNDPAGEMTQTGQFVGSLPWASPEQVAGDPDALDLRTDVYSLGVLLYQMLVGRFPYPVTGRATEVVAHIQRTDPEPPRRLRRGVPHDVEVIVLTCLQKDRERRYQSAVELARDIRHYLNREPIEARRDSFTYVLRKHLARHKVPVTLATAFVVLITTGFLVSLAFWRQAARARDAEAEQTKLAERSAAAAQAEADKANAINAFVEEMLLAANPEESGGPKVTMAEVLDAAAARIDSASLAEQPLVRAALHALIGNAYLRLGMHERAQDHTAAALTLRRALWPGDHLDVARSLQDLGMVARAAGRLKESEAHYREALAMLDRLDAGDPYTRDTLANLALTLRDRGQLESAREICARLLSVERKSLSPQSIKLAATLNNYALVLRELNRPDEAEPLFEEALAIVRAVHGERHVLVAGILESLGAIWVDRNKLDQAEPIYREALAVRREILGDEHPHVALGLSNLGYLLYRKKDYAGAEPLYEEALALRRKLLGDDHPDVAATLNNLALLHFTTGDYARAEPLYREALTIRRKRLGESHPNTLNVAANLVALLRARDEPAAGAELARESLALAERDLPAEHWYRPRFRAQLGACLRELGQLDDAERELSAAYGEFADLHNPNAPVVADQLASLCDELQRPADGVRWRELGAAPTTQPSADPR